jgi:tRNA threonylcarbamoyladenosine biosynthesis protein TsaB
MRVLAFDTATRATTVALCGTDGGGAVERRDDPPAGARPGHAARLLPLVADVMAAAGVGWEAVDRIAVGVGPGTFTGLRIGVATARALAAARAIPLVGVSTLRSLAVNGVGSAAGEAWVGRRAVAAVLDARRSEVFAAVWRGTDQLLKPRAVAPEQLATELRSLGVPVLAIGDGAVAFRTVIERSGAVIPEDGSGLHRVTATNHCALAGESRAGALEDVLPAYLRLPDAEIAHRARVNK